MMRSAALQQVADRREQWRTSIKLMAHMKPLAELKNRHAGEPAYIVGMGPSLLHLTPQHVGSGVIIATYESIALIESWGLPNPIYSLQKDDVIVLPHYSPLLLHERESAQHGHTYQPCYVFETTRDFGKHLTNTGWTSVRIALHLGCRDITCLCCDMTTLGDRRRAILRDGQFVLDSTEDPLLYNQAQEVEELVNKFHATCTWITP